MGNKSVKPKVNQVPGIPSAECEIPQSQNLPFQVIRPNEDLSRTGKKPQLRRSKRTNVARKVSDQKDMILPNYNDLDYPLLQPGNSIPVRAQRPRPSSQRKPDRNEQSMLKQSIARAHQLGTNRQELLSYPFGRVKCRSQMSDYAGSSCSPAQLYRLTDPMRNRHRACLSKAASYPRPSTSTGRSLCKSALEYPTPRGSPAQVNNLLNASNVNSPLFQVVPSLKPIAELLQEFNRLCLLLPDTLRHAMDDLVDYNMFTHIRQNEANQRHLMSASIQSNLVLLGELIPLMSQHILNAQDLFQSLHRMEEKFLTFQRLVEQMNIWTSPSSAKYALGVQPVAD